MPGAVAGAHQRRDLGARACASASCPWAEAESAGMRPATGGRRNWMLRLVARPRCSRCSDTGTTPFLALLEATPPGSHHRRRTPAIGSRSARHGAPAASPCWETRPHPLTPNVLWPGRLHGDRGRGLASRKQLLWRSLASAAGFRAYEALRRPRTAHVTRQARRIGAIGQWENPWMVKARDAITRLVLLALQHAAQRDLRVRGLGAGDLAASSARWTAARRFRSA